MKKKSSLNNAAKVIGFVKELSKSAGLNEKQVVDATAGMYTPEEVEDASEFMQALNQPEDDTGGQYDALRNVLGKTVEEQEQYDLPVYDASPLLDSTEEENTDQ